MIRQVGIVFYSLKLKEIYFETFRPPKLQQQEEHLQHFSNPTQIYRPKIKLPKIKTQSFRGSKVCHKMGRSSQRGQKPVTLYFEFHFEQVVDRGWDEEKKSV